MAKGLKLEVLAEGVETKRQFEVLKEMGCGYIQGYLLSKPLPPQQFAQLIDQVKQAN